jgi:Ornithine/acetylornithine aminotransferase
VTLNGHEHTVFYDPAESTTGLFGGNSNWRGPIWFPVNYLLIESLQKYHYYYGDAFTVEFPSGSGVQMDLSQVAAEISRRLTRIFLRDENGARPVNGADRRYADDPNWRDLVTFYEYFHGDTAAGLGASHQTGWTGWWRSCCNKAASGRRIENFGSKLGDMLSRILLLTTIAAGFVSADTLTLRSGRVVQGTYLGGDSRRVKMAVDDRVDSFNVDEITDLRFGPGASLRRRPKQRPERSASRFYVRRGRSRAPITRVWRFHRGRRWW